MGVVLSDVFQLILKLCRISHVYHYNRDDYPLLFKICLSISISCLFMLFMVYLNLFYSKQWVIKRTLSIEHIEEKRPPHENQSIYKKHLYPFRITFMHRFTLSTLYKYTKTFLLLWLKSKVTHTKTRGKSLLITSQNAQSFDIVSLLTLLIVFQRCKDFIYPKI